MVYNEEDLVKGGNGICIEESVLQFPPPQTQIPIPSRRTLPLNSGGSLLHPAACLPAVLPWECNYIITAQEEHCGKGRRSQHAPSYSMPGSIIKKTVKDWGRGSEAETPTLKLSQPLLWVLPYWGHSSVVSGSYQSQR